MCFSSIECMVLRIWISRFFKGVLSRGKRGCAIATTSNMTVRTCVRKAYLMELVRDIELRSHTWRQTDDASDRPRKFRSLCIYTRFFGLRATRGVGDATICASAQEEFSDHDPLRKRMRAEKRGCGMRYTWHRRIRIINPSAESPWLFRGRYSPRCDFAVCMRNMPIIIVVLDLNRCHAGIARRRCALVTDISPSPRSLPPPSPPRF